MKIAVVYSGEPRSYSDVVDQHNEFLEGLDFDTYHSTWTKTSDQDIEIIKKAPNIRQITKTDYGVNDRPDLHRFETLLLNTKKNHPIFMLGRIQYMTGMAFLPFYYSNTKYDYVVRLRYDFKFEGKLKDYLHLVRQPNDIVITRKMGGKSSPINVWDGFAFGTPAAMTWYFDFHRWIPFSLFNNNVYNWKYQPEFVLGTYLRHCHLNVVESDIQPTHVYPNGKDVNFHREMRTIQYYRDLAIFHPQFYTHSNGKLTIENDSPSVTDEHIISSLEKEGLVCNEVQ